MGFGRAGFDQINEVCPREIEAEQIEALFGAMRNTGVQVTDDTAPLSSPICSFCGKAQEDVVQLIAGPAGFICNGCVQLCVRIIANDHPDWLADHIAFVQALATKGPDGDPRKE